MPRTPAGSGGRSAEGGRGARPWRPRREPPGRWWRRDGGGRELREVDGVAELRSRTPVSRGASTGASPGATPEATPPCAPRPNRLGRGTPRADLTRASATAHRVGPVDLKRVHR